MSWLSARLVQQTASLTFYVLGLFRPNRRFLGCSPESELAVHAGTWRGLSTSSVDVQDQSRYTRLIAVILLS